MKERFLNVFLFLFSLVFITAGVLSIFFYKLQFMALPNDYFVNAFKDSHLALFMMQSVGAFVLSWGIFFLLMTVYAVMDLKNRSIYGFIFWVYTFWALSFGYVAYKNNYMFLVFVLCGIYGIIFLPFLIGLLLKGRGDNNKPGGVV